MTSKRVTLNAIILFGGTVLGNLFAFLFQTIIAREFGAAVYGSFSLATSMLLIIATPSMLGFPGALVKFIGEKSNESELSGVLRLGLAIPMCISLLGSAILYFAGEPLSTILFQSNDAARFVRIFAFALPAVVLARLLGATLMGFERAEGRVITEEITRGGVLLGGSFIVIVIGYNMFSVAIVYVISYWAAGIVGLAFLFKISNFNIRATPQYAPKELVYFSLPLLLSSQAGLISNWIDTILVGVITKNDSLVGVYQSSFILGTTVLIFWKAIGGSLYPNFSKLIGQNNGEELTEKYEKGTRWAVILTTAPTLYLSIFSQNSLSIIFGPEFGVGGFALAVIVLGNLGGVIVGPGTEVVKSLGHGRIVLLTEVIGLISNILINIALIPFVGIVGAAAGTAFASIITNLSQFLWSRRHFSLKIPVWSIIRSISVAAAAGLLLSVLTANVTNIIGLGLHAILFSIIYVVGLILTREIKTSDYEKIKNLMSRT
jgi:O-antigen/teichoic acid export membrane protein